MGYKHGGKGTRLYVIWKHARQRCFDPRDKQFQNYGGRGIRMATAWDDFAAFRSYVDQYLGPCPDGYTMDRINVDGNYEPGNLRWASRQQQAENRRRSVWITFGGCRATVQQWSEVLGLSAGNLSRFLDKTEFSEVFRYYSGRYHMGITR